VSIVQDLQALPLFQGIAEDRLAQLVGAFRQVKHSAGTILFRPGDPATQFEILTAGQVTLEEARSSESSTAGTVRFELRPLAPLGELGALTGIPRSTTATATSDVELYSIGVSDLLGFFDAHSDIGFSFSKNLLNIVSDKVRRDRRRIEDMRTNIIRTQKAMKQMRETVLAAEETEISKPLYETLDTLIDSNRRANYRVMPVSSYPAHVRLDDGKNVRVLELSEGYMKVEGRTEDITSDPSYWAGILVLPQAEILISGAVVREGGGGVVLRLDKLIDEFKSTLDDYTTRVQLLDFVV
jgi:CRP-like cAMP-binding protein